MRSCPTQAIRVRHGGARIAEDLCVDCGACLAVCPVGAIEPSTDPVGEISHFKYRVVVPSAVLYTQFDSSLHPYLIHLAFRQLGFDEVVDVSDASICMSRVLAKFLQTHQGPRPLISSHCPSTVRLIQVKYPDLVDSVVPLDAPREVTAREARHSAARRRNLRPEEIGIFYISPCTAKTVSIKQPAEKARSWFDGVVSMRDAYAVLRPLVLSLAENFDESRVPDDFRFGVGWATLGVLTGAVETENWIAVSGLDHVKKILDDIENSRLRNVDFVEAVSCMMGCISGSFNVENPYLARANHIKQRERHACDVVVDEEEIDRRMAEGYYSLESPVRPRRTKNFAEDLETSIRRMKERERVYQKLRQIDCGCCGAPTCLAFAEDFVRGEAELTDCVFLSHAQGKSEE
jgi:Fe-S-cluster-containing hydrogenase component 2